MGVRLELAEDETDVEGAVSAPVWAGPLLEALDESTTASPTATPMAATTSVPRIPIAIQAPRGHRPAIRLRTGGSASGGALDAGGA